MANTAGSWFDKGNALLLLGSYKEAIKCYDEVIKIEPNRASVWAGKGRALVLSGKYEDAIECYDKSIRINSQDANIWTLKGLALSELGRCEEAIKCYDEAIRINPQNAIAWKGKGSALVCWVKTKRHFPILIKLSRSIEMMEKPGTAKALPFNLSIETLKLHLIWPRS